MRWANCRTASRSASPVFPPDPTNDHTMRRNERKGTAYWSKGGAGCPLYWTMIRLGTPR